MTVRVLRRVRLEIEGTVQGVGFRPFVHRLAKELDLGGWVANSSSGALLEVEGPSELVETFVQRLSADAPAAARVEEVTLRPVSLSGETAFTIRASTDETDGMERRLVIAPDLATCEDCLREMRDSGDRRHRYPFLTCTQCGPRYSVITGIPYDRSRTTMEGFPLCATCRTEYEMDADRRFHAESVACPRCGPQVVLWDAQGRSLAGRDAAVQQAGQFLREGRILAVKGLGGFQLWVDAGSDSAVIRLRERKRRPHKPFALLFPSLEAVRAACDLSGEEEALLTSPQAPILLLRRKTPAGLASAVAPDNPFVGAMLPNLPLHHLLMAELGAPMVATSGNRSEEPIVTDNQEALTRLGDIADAFLVHDRPIARPVDDSVARVIEGEGVILRRARGYAPQAVPVPGPVPVPILAVGGQLKNTVALAQGDQVVLSQHLGDLGTAESVMAFRRAVGDLQTLLNGTPQLIACDLHPDYHSTRFAHELALRLAVPVVPVQHHHAHVAACMAEHGLTGEVLGVAWDGAGFGPDRTLWGGEFLVAGYAGYRRMANLQPFRLPGGERAMREPRRLALSMLWEALGHDGLTIIGPHRLSLGQDIDVISTMVRQGVASPWTTGMGRLFDAVASLLDICQVATFEGQAAMAVEALAEQYERSPACVAERAGTSYAIPLLPKTARAAAPSGSDWVADWRPMIRDLVRDLHRGFPPGCLAYRFHQALADLVGQAAQVAGLPRVVLTGGCFQNALLTRLTRQRLQQAGFTVYTHRLVPPNDGGLALGQAMVAAHQPGVTT